MAIATIIAIVEAAKYISNGGEAATGCTVAVGCGAVSTANEVTA